MTYALAALLLLMAYRLRSKYRDDRHLIEACTAAYLRGRGDGFDSGFVAGARTSEQLREEGRL